MSHLFDAGEVYGGREINKPGEVKDAILSEDKDGNPVLFLYIDIGHKAGNPRSPREGGGEAIPPGEEQVRLFLGQEEDESQTKRRKIALDQLSAILDTRLEDTPDTVLRFMPEAKDSLIPKLVGKAVWLKATESNGKVYMNLHIPRQKPQPLTVKALREKLKARREREAATTEGNG